MAELLLKIDAGSGYEDGDILCAFNSRDIQCVHAQHICHPWANGLNGHGLRLRNSVAEDFFLLTHQYKFERVSETEIMRTDLLTNEQDLLSATPNEKGEAIDVPQFIARRIREKAPDGGPKLAMFGERGKEVWFGGRVDFSQTKVSAVWNAIETRTAHRRTQPQFSQWPLGQQDKRSHLAVPVNDFTDAESESLVSPMLNQVDPQVVVKKRARGVNWRSLLTQLQLSEADVQNKLKEVDPRNRAPLARAAIVTQKARPA